ncbi:hypothetical protein M0R45_030396 [Rubus argutus]|uniref:Uncharacterized protein n=1 Tax=Rubus argutus TaxID=59490 RepID=A0AAW1WCV2_RUBAR
MSNGLQISVAGGWFWLRATRAREAVWAVLKLPERGLRRCLESRSRFYGGCPVVVRWNSVTCSRHPYSSGWSDRDVHDGKCPKQINSFSWWTTGIMRKWTARVRQMNVQLDAWLHG